MNNLRINKQRLRADFSKAALSYDEAAIAQHTICDRTLERLEILKVNPKTILDIGTGTGRSIIGLRNAFPGSSIVANDIALPMLEVCINSGSLDENCSLVCNDTQQLPFDDEVFDLIFSTSTFQWCDDINQVFSECNRVLCKGGVLIFSTFGPETLIELRRSWSKVDDLEHVHEFLDMHHIGDMMLENKFQDPVVDMEVLTIKYKKFNQLLRDLKETGSRGKFNSKVTNPLTGLMGKKKYLNLERAYEKYRSADGTLPASYEVIYGYAKKIGQGQKSDGLSEIMVSIDNVQLKKY